MHGVEVVEELVQVEVEMREQVDLVDQHELAGPEHQRVLRRLLLALGDRGDHDPGVLADSELRGTDEVADVLDHEEVDVVERQVGERGAHHVRIEVTLAAEARGGVELGHGNVQRGQPVRIHRPLNVALQHADTHSRKLGDHPFEQRRLPRSGSAHEVHDLHAGAVEVRPVGLGDRVVRVESLLDDLVAVVRVAAPLPSRCWPTSSSSSP